MKDVYMALDAANRIKVEPYMTDPETVMICTWIDRGKRHFDDDIEGACHDCGGQIIHRPWAAPIVRKICVKCGMDRADGGHA